MQSQSSRSRLVYSFTLPLFLIGIVSCTPSQSTPANIESNGDLLTDLPRTEARQDTEQLGKTLSALYGPYEYKEELFGLDIARMMRQAMWTIQQGDSDAEVFSLWQKALAKLDDGHVSISFIDNSSPISLYYIPCLPVPVQGRAIITGCAPTVPSVAPGDELLAIDGEPIADIVTRIDPYLGLANSRSRLHISYLSLMQRPFFMVDVQPDPSQPATLTLRRSDGSTYDTSADWLLNYFVDPSLGQMTKIAGDVMAFAPDVARQKFAAEHSDAFIFALGAPQPFFLTPPVVATYGMRAAGASEATMAKYGLTPETFPTDVFSARYNHNGKELLLIRVSDYVPPDPELRLNAYRAILDEHDDAVDGLVIDQTNNPGGSVIYLESLFRLFIDQPQPRMVFATNTDRRWINLFRSIAQIAPTPEEAQAALTYASLIEQAYDEGRALSDRVPVPVVNGPGYTMAPDALYNWPGDKPILLLINELAGSGGDAFPMLMTRSGTSQAFGATTWGLGGNVEEVAQLLHSGATLRVTRSLFTSYRADGNYTTDFEIENNGISPTPGLEHEITLDDFQAGFTDYVGAFSQAITDRIE